VKVSELEGATLDYWVARAEGIAGAKVEPYKYSDGDGKFVCLIPGLKAVDISDPVRKVPCMRGYHPSWKWGEGGPIIEREHISIDFYGTHWGAMPKNVNGKEIAHPDPAFHERMASGWRPVMATGSSPLIAAMRAFVVSRLGEEVGGVMVDIKR
jgi:hypothetical protein